MNIYTLYSDIKRALEQENWLVNGYGLNYADKCIKCGRCEQVCPQHIKIRDELAKVVEKLH